MSEVKTIRGGEGGSMFCFFANLLFLKMRVKATETANTSNNPIPNMIQGRTVSTKVEAIADERESGNNDNYPIFRL